MAWQQLQIQVSKEQVSQVTTWLQLLNAISVTYLDARDQPLFEPKPGTTPLWEQTIICALFAEEVAMEPILAFIQEQGILDIKSIFISEEDWQKKSQQAFQPMKFGDHLWICPSWHQVDEAKAVVVKLDPGLAFGTGAHATTRLCLTWLAMSDLRHKTVLDFGCGSGILSLAAAKLGAQSVYAHDIDPQAIVATKENQVRNQVSKQQLIASIEKPSGQFDVVVANILLNPLIELHKLLVACVKPNGYLVLSGILHEQVDGILAVYDSYCDDWQVKYDHEWALIVGQLKAAKKTCE